VETETVHDGIRQKLFVISHGKQIETVHWHQAETVYDITESRNSLWLQAETVCDITWSRNSPVCDITWKAETVQAS
jgi:hypothetical protein